MSGSAADLAFLDNIFSSGAGSAYSLPSGSLNGVGDLAGNNYYPGGGTWWDRNVGMNSGASSSGDLTKALAGWGKQAGGAAAGAGGGGSSGEVQPPGGGPTGRPASPVSLNQLVQILNQRREALLNSATGVGQQAQAQPSPRVLGLLGF